MERKDISPYELENIIRMIGKDWMLITASDGERVNTMTASWGMMGVLWNKEVCTVFIRPQRYTAELMPKTEHLTLSFFDECYRDALKLCGRISGRDGDKFEKAGLTLFDMDGVPAIEQARINIKCRKLYTDVLREESFVEPALLSNYTTKDYHQIYVCEIERILLG